MPPFALANHMWLGGCHPWYKELSLGMRMLLSRGRIIMRQLFLGKGRDDEVQKGLAGNPMLIAQAQATPEQIVPSVQAACEALVVLFCGSADDVRHAQALVVEREPYQRCVELRKQVRPTFADVTIASHAIAQELPEHGVPDSFAACAQHMPEVEHLKTTMEGPASRRTMSSTGLDDDGAMVEDEDEGAEEVTEGDAAGTSHVDEGAAETLLGSDAPQLAANAGCDAAQRDADEPGASETSAHETVVGLDPEAHGDFEYLKHFEAMQVKLQLLNAEAAKLSRTSANGSTDAVDAAEVGREEHVRRIVRDVQDVMKRLTKKQSRVG